VSRSKIWFVAAFAVVLTASAALPAAAQEPGPPQFLLVHTETIRPPMMDAYVENTKAFVDMVQKHRDVMKTFNAAAFQTDEMEMVYVMPMTSFADMDTLSGEFMAMEQAGGDAWKQLMEQGAGTTVKADEWVVIRLADASYEAAEPAVTPEAAKVFRWDFYYLEPGKEADATQLAKDVKALYEQKGLHDSWSVFQAIMGSELPYFVVGTPGTSPADIEARRQAAQAALGDAWTKVEQRISSLVRSTRTVYAWARPDLSIPPPAMEKMEE